MVLFRCKWWLDFLFVSIEQSCAQVIRVAMRLGVFAASTSLALRIVVDVELHVGVDIELATLVAPFQGIEGLARATSLRGTRLSATTGLSSGRAVLVGLAWG